VTAVRRFTKFVGLKWVRKFRVWVVFAAMTSPSGSCQAATAASLASVNQTVSTACGQSAFMIVRKSVLTFGVAAT
jgi:hypothetical protein